MNKVHMRDIRLSCNAGMDFPMCYARAKLLDLDKGHLTTTGNLEKVTCKRCLKDFAKRYEWAMTAKNAKIIEAALKGGSNG